MLKRYIAAVLLAAILLSSFICILPASAEGDDEPLPEEPIVESAAVKAGAIVKSAVSSLFGGDNFNGDVGEVFGGFFSDAGMINKGDSFSKSVGVMKIASDDELENIRLQIAGTINNILSDKADNAIKSRAGSAKNYFDIYSEFCNEGPDKLIESIRNEAMHVWYDAETAEDRVGTLDNSQVFLIYLKKGDYFPENVYPEIKGDIIDDKSASETAEDEKSDVEEVLVYTTENGAPEGSGYIVIKIDSSMLPTKSDVADWDENTYRDELFSFIREKAEQNYEILNPTVSEEKQLDETDEAEPEEEKNELAESFKDEFLDRIAADTVNVLIYRATAEKIIKDPDLVKTVVDAFNEYKQDLLAADRGFDAIIKALYYTHAFEYEIYGTVNKLLSEFVFRIAYYGAFVNDIAAMTGVSDIDGFNDNMYDVIISLEKIKNSALTGKTGYCYVTNTVLYYCTLSMSASAKIKTLSDGSGAIYDSYNATGFTVDIYRYDENVQKVNYTKNQLIGNNTAALISASLRYNGISADHKYFADHLCVGSVVTDNNKAIIVSLDNENELPDDSDVPLYVKKVIGSYFTDGDTVTAEELDTGYMYWRRMICGSIFDFADGVSTPNETVAAFGIFGESHWYLPNDNSVFLSGPSTGTVARTYEKVCTKETGKKKYDHNFGVTFSYNCIVEEPLTVKTEDENEVNTLLAYRILTDYEAPSNDFTPVVPETSSSPERNGSKAGFYAIIIVPVAVLVIGASIVAAVFIVRSKGKRRRI